MPSFSVAVVCSLKLLFKYTYNTYDVMRLDAHGCMGHAHDTTRGSTYNHLRTLIDVRAFEGLLLLLLYRLTSIFAYHTINGRRNYARFSKKITCSGIASFMYKNVPFMLRTCKHELILLLQHVDNKHAPRRERTATAIWKY